MYAAPYLAFQHLSSHGNDSFLNLKTRRHLCNQWVNSHRQASSADIPKPCPWQDSLQQPKGHAVIHLVQPLPMVAQDHAACDGKSPGDAGESDDTLPRATQSTTAAFGVRYPPSPRIPAPFSHCSEAQANKFWKKIQKNSPGLRWMTLPSGSLQDYHSLTMGGGLHPSHFCSQEGPGAYSPSSAVWAKTLEHKARAPLPVAASSRDAGGTTGGSSMYLISSAVPQLPCHNCHWACFKTHIWN